MKYIQVRIYGVAARKLRTAARKNRRSSSQEATQIIDNHYGFQTITATPIPNTPDHK